MVEQERAKDHLRVVRVTPKVILGPSPLLSPSVQVITKSTRPKLRDGQFFYSMLTTLLGPLERLSAINLKVQEAFVASERLSQVMDLEPETTAAGKIAFAGVHDSIEL